jgi:hypothetical protein
MSCENKNRKRNRILNFRVSEEELRLINAKVAVSGLDKGDYLIRILYGETIVIRAGKYQSDRLAVELKKLRTALEKVSDLEEIRDAVEKCSALLEEMIRISTKTSDKDNPNGEF